MWAKNCLVDVFSVVVAPLDAVVLFEGVLECGDVEESFVLEHSCADSLGELLDLFHNVC